MSAEIAHQIADKHLYVTLARKMRFRLHLSVESDCGIASRKLCGMMPYYEKKHSFS
jgi:hypothetical protein